MQAVKWIVVALLVYVGIVAAFESLIGFFQPAGASTLVLTTMDANEVAHDRVVARLETDGNLYVAVNHWPRAWYRRALENPNVKVTLDGKQADYLAVFVTGAEYDRVERKHHAGIVFRLLTGFPPRYFFRLDPR